MITTKKVEEFHKLFNHPIGQVNELEARETRQLRIKLIFEELMELAEAGDMRGTAFDLCRQYIESNDLHSGEDGGMPMKTYEDGDEVNKVEELDALCDLEYVLQGKVLTAGLQDYIGTAFQLVHANNMKKAHRGEEHVQRTLEAISISEKRSLMNVMTCYKVLHKPEGVLLIRNDGKLTKPHDHKKVDLKTLLPDTTI